MNVFSQLNAHDIWALTEEQRAEIFAWLEEHEEEKNNVSRITIYEGELPVQKVFITVFLLNERGKRYIDPLDPSSAASATHELVLKRPIPV